MNYILVLFFCKNSLEGAHFFKKSVMCVKNTVWCSLYSTRSIFFKSVVCKKEHGSRVSPCIILFFQKLLYVKNSILLEMYFVI